MRGWTGTDSDLPCREFVPGPNHRAWLFLPWVARYHRFISLHVASIHFLPRSRYAACTLGCAHWRTLMKTGTDVTRAGLYASDCCLAETGLRKDAMFPRCPKCLNLTVWISVAEPVPAKSKKAACSAGT